MEKFSRHNHITIPGFAIADLGLSGNELICFSLIYGFCQDGESEFYGSITYLASAMNITRRGVFKVIQSIARQGLVVKRDDVVNGVKYCRYTISEDVMNKIHQWGSEKSSPVVNKQHRGGEQSSRRVVKKVHGGSEQSAPNNINNNITDNTNDTITQAEVVDEGELRYQKFVDWLTKSAPHLLKLQKTFTKDEFLKLRAEYTSQDIMSLCLEMENYKDLTKRYTSAYLTFRSWMKRRKTNSNGTAKTATSEREQRINQIDEYIAGKYGIDMGRY